MSRGWFAMLGIAIAAAAAAGEPLAPYAVERGAIPLPLAGKPGDARRGRQLLLAREAANCLLCHEIPDAQARFAGNLGPSLTGVGARLTAGEIRLRIVDAGRVNPDTIMPPYHRVEGLAQVAAEYQGRPILGAQQVEDIVAYLSGLR